MTTRYSVLVVWKDGTEEYVCEGTGNRPVVYHNRRAAQEAKEFILFGDDQYIQSVNVVRARARGVRNE